MAKQATVLDTLMQFKTVLVEEQQALIKNDSANVKTIVEKKQIFLDILPTLSTEGLEKSDLSQVVEDIKNVQQTNLTLMQQSIHYQETVMEAITKWVTKGGSTYSKQGDYGAAQQVNIIDQSL